MGGYSTSGARLLQSPAAPRPPEPTGHPLVPPGFREGLLEATGPGVLEQTHLRTSGAPAITPPRLDAPRPAAERIPPPPPVGPC